MIRCDTTRAGQPQKMLEACNFGLRKKRDWATYVAKTKVPLSSHVQKQVFSRCGSDEGLGIKRTRNY